MRRLLAAATLGAMLAGCGLQFSFDNRPADRQPVSGDVIGPIIAAPNGGPPIECRGLSRERCEGPGSIEDGTAGVSVADVERVIVSCESDRCDEDGGAFRIDVLLESGYTQEIGRGGYGEAEQP